LAEGKRLRDAGRLVGVDWGGSNLRAFRFGPEGQAGDARSSPDGLATLDGRSFETVLSAAIGDWRVAAGAPLRIVLCGMVGGRGGWLEAPYVPCPADQEAVAAGMVRLETSLGPAWIVPGLSTFDRGLSDVMRGEETQIFGAIDPSAEALVVAPGTHSKWCRVGKGRIDGFRTYMTGELFAVLKSHSILGRLMRGQAHDQAAFVRGVQLSLDDPDLLRLLFTVRSETLFDRIAPEAAAAYLSGLLIGAEVRAGLAEMHDARGAPILVIAAEGLAGPYRTALTLAGAEPARVIDGAGASARGLWRLAQIREPA
jgi:2-dehydro-3-deoxygalactonokinase